MATNVMATNVMAKEVMIATESGYKIHVVGLGVAAEAKLSADVVALLAAASVVIGSDRQLATVAALSLSNTALLPKLAELKALLASYQGQGPVVVLASGDPLYYGIGAWFVRHFEREQLVFYPAVSSIQTACHRLGLSLQGVTVLSLHGRPLSQLRRRLKNDATLVVLTDQASEPQALARQCRSAGFTHSRITVLENLGYPQERIRSFSVDELINGGDFEFEPLHISVINVRGIAVLPSFTGIPDSDFETGAAPGKGMISKREVRLAIVSLLQPAAGDIIWDVGAGCGGVAVELAYGLAQMQAQAQVHAIEHHPQRLKYLATNQQHFAVAENLHIHAATAPACFDALPRANKIFIGGSDGQLESLLVLSWQRLPAGGMLVASAVLETSKAQLRAFAQVLLSGSSLSVFALSMTSATDSDETCGQCIDFESVEIEVTRGQWLDGALEYTKRKPVAIFKFVKGAGA